MYVPYGSAGYLHSEAGELDRKLREGDGLVWQGDPDLVLQVGVLLAARSGVDRKTGIYRQKGDTVARRYEVHRHTEKGEDVIVGHWRLDEFDKILLDLVKMDPRSRGHVGVEASIEDANAVTEAAADTALVEAMSEMVEHGSKLAHDTENPRNVFRGISGTRDTPLPDAVE